MPIGTGELRRTHSRVVWMLRPVERSMTVSAPHLVAQVILSTSSSMEEVTAEFPMLAFTFTRNRLPMIIGSISGWLTLVSRTARPAAISSRTTSGSTFSLIATYSISGVISPRRAYASWVTGRPSRLRRGCLGQAREDRVEVAQPPRGEVCFSPSSSGLVGLPAYSSVSPRAMIQFSRSGARPRRTSVSTPGSVYGPDVSYSVTSLPLVRCTCRTGTRRSGREPWT